MLERLENWRLETPPYYSMENADLEELGPAWRCRAAFSVLTINMAIVKGPTPPGTGV